MSESGERTAGADRPGTITVHVEAVSWVNQFVGGSGTGTVELSEQARPGDSVRTVLKQLSRRHPKLHESLWDEENRNELGPHIEVIVNDAVLGVAHDLDSPLQEGDRILLAGQYIGG